MACVVAALAACGGSGSGSSATHVLDGSVLILNEIHFSTNGTKCQGINVFDDIVPGATVTISPKGKDKVTTQLSEGAITPEGNCRLKFTPTIPEASSYVFVVGDKPAETRDKSFIDGSNGSRDGWWVTFDWDS
jgi:hypothetical protein